MTSSLETVIWGIHVNDDEDWAPSPPEEVGQLMESTLDFISLLGSWNPVPLHAHVAFSVLDESYRLAERLQGAPNDAGNLPVLVLGNVLGLVNAAPMLYSSFRGADNLWLYLTEAPLTAAASHTVGCQGPWQASSGATQT